ncbi:hypothetical protein MRX96_033592 [Rhipicephalus microplus]
MDERLSFHGIGRLHVEPSRPNPRESNRRRRPHAHRPRKREAISRPADGKRLQLCEEDEPARPHMQKVPGYAVHQSWHTRVDLSARVHTQSSPEHHAFLFSIGTIYDVFGKIRDDAEEGCARLRERLTGCGEVDYRIDLQSSHTRLQ